MKLTVRSGKFRFSMRLPLRIALWAMTRGKTDGDAAAFAKFYEENRKKVRKIFKEARRNRRGLELVRAESAGGDEVVISL